MLSSVCSLKDMEQLSTSEQIHYLDIHIQSVWTAEETDKLKDIMMGLLSLYAIIVHSAIIWENGYKVHETKIKLNQLFSLVSQLTISGQEEMLEKFNTYGIFR